METQVFLSGAICGAGWWIVSWILGAGANVIWGSHALTGLVAGVATGIVTTAISLPIYRGLSSNSLYWYAPLSVYFTVAIYGLAIFAVRELIGDFDRNQIRWAVGVQSIVGMWWAITILVPYALLVHALALVNHRILRRLLTAR